MSSILGIDFNEDPLRDLHALVLSGACGIIFGIAMEKGKVHDPAVIRGQMDFSSWVMMKMFISASAAGMLSLGLMSNMSITKDVVETAKAAFLSSIIPKKGFLSAVTGGAVLGVGMVFSGSCPGSLFPQIGVQTENCLYTLGGCYLGALAYGFCSSHMDEMMRPNDHSTAQGLDTYLKQEFVTIAIPLACCLLVASELLEFIMEWTAEVTPNAAVNILDMKYWKPQISGLLVGLLQVPIVLTLGRTLGTSLTYCTTLSPFFQLEPLRSSCPYLSSKYHGYHNWWQVWYAGGAIMGAYISASRTGSIPLQSPVSPVEGLLGGFLIVFGSRLAGGCTSSHGLSGMALTVFNSFIAVGSMFAGAIATKLAMNQGCFNMLK